MSDNPFDFILNSPLEDPQRHRVAYTLNLRKNEAATDEWVEAINANRQFGVWRYGICEKPQQELEYLCCQAQ